MVYLLSDGKLEVKICLANFLDVRVETKVSLGGGCKQNEEFEEGFWVLGDVR